MPYQPFARNCLRNRLRNCHLSFSRGMPDAIRDCLALCCPSSAANGLRPAPWGRKLAALASVDRMEIQDGAFGKVSSDSSLGQLPTILDARNRMQSNFSQQIWSSECQSSCNNEKQDFFATWCLSSCKDLNVPSEGTLKRKSKGRTIHTKGIHTKGATYRDFERNLRHPETLFVSRWISASIRHWHFHCCTSACPKSRSGLSLSENKANVIAHLCASEVLMVSGVSLLEPPLSSQLQGVVDWATSVMSC
jgi:hypothetical protein